MKTRLILLALACLLVAAPATAQVNYAVSGGAAYVTSSPNASGNIVIASTFNGFPVTSIGHWAFANCTNLTSVTIPNSVIGMGYQPFTGCTSLTNLSVDAAHPALSSPDGVLFNKAQTGLIVFPAGRGGSYVIPDSVTGIGVSAFYLCTRLTSVTIPNSVTRIEESAFRNCTSLTSVTIPNSVTRIEESAFRNCTSLTSVTIPNSVTSFGSQAFSGCTSLESVTIPNGVTGIGHEMFLGCSSLTSVAIPNSVTSIGYLAFSGCTSLTSLTIPNSVTSIGFRPFAGCANLTNLSVDAANPAYSSLDGVVFDKAQTTLLFFPPGRGSYVMPDSVTRIGTTLYAGGGGGFSFCTSLTNVIIGNSVTNIGSEAFSACSNLTRLTIPASVINLGYGAFLGSSRLTNFTFLGNAPRLIFDMDGGFAQFQNVGAGAKAYYYCGTTGWGPTYGGLPTVMLCPPQIAPGGAGVKPGGFGFTLTRLTNQTIVVEASDNLVNWQPIWTNPPPGVSTDFVDPEWLQHSNRFYRARSN